MLEEITKLIETMDGLEVHFVVGKESELIIKGDFLTMAKMAAKLAKREIDDSERNSKIKELEEQIRYLKDKA